MFAARFDPTGHNIASGSMDRDIRRCSKPGDLHYALTSTPVLWHTSGDCENYGVLSGHKGAVLDLHWSRDSRVIYSASADMLLASWDLESGQRIRKHPGHEEVINCMDVSKRGGEYLISGSDDGYIGVG